MHLHRLVQLSPEAEASLGDIKAVYFMAHAPECSLGILVRSEGGYWMVSTGGYLGKRPPMKDEQFFAWAQQVAANNVLAFSTLCDN